METRTFTDAASAAPACIWSQAGVVKRRECRIDYECPACPFDRALQRAARENRKRREQGAFLRGRRGGIVSWKEKLRELPAGKRPCLHAMKQRIAFRACSHDYLCRNCDFDQYFNDQFSVFAVVRRVDVQDVKGIKFPQGYYLHPGHCWVKLEEGAEVRIGLDDFARRVLGPMDRILSPLMGKEVRSGGVAFAVGRGAHSASVLAPVAGVVTAVNPRLLAQGGLPQADPYAEGWILRMHAGGLRRDLGGLLFGEEAVRFIDAELEGVHELIEAAAGPLAADGGHLAEDLFDNLPELGWENLVRRFLRS
ncbi:MAG: glycine cleavage system protein H [Desulfobacterales bacterium]|jgi:glycine cleavage system H lipoate-binding protein|nr:glycine cleavage system protein H [Desulfobacterales bacterium]